METKTELWTVEKIPLEEYQELILVKDDHEKFEAKLWELSNKYKVMYVKLLSYFKGLIEGEENIQKEEEEEVEKKEEYKPEPILREENELEKFEKFLRIDKLITYASYELFIIVGMRVFTIFCNSIKAGRSDL